MAHAIEADDNMAWVKEKPWHGLGTEVDQNITVDGMMRAANLDWGVERRPIFDGEGNEIEGFAAITRDSDNKVFDICGSRYVPTQNAQAFEFFKEFVERGDAHMETAGSLKGGKYVWGLANLGNSFKLAGGDEVKGYVLVGCPHEQGKSLIIKFTPIRVVCNNTLTMALRQSSVHGEIRRAHRSEFDLNAVKHAHETLGIAREQLDEFADTAKALKKKSMSFEDHVDVLTRVFQPKIHSDKEKLKAAQSGVVTNKMQELLDCLHKAPGADPNTAWGTLNAVTYWADHRASRNADNRLTNSWFGKTSRQKLETMKVLVEA